MIASMTLTTSAPTAPPRSRRALASMTAALAAGATLAFAPSASAATIPIAPSNLVVHDTPNSVMVLTWADNSSDEASFEIQRCRNTSTIDASGNLVIGGCTSDLDFALRATVPADTTSYSDPAFGAYTYRVRAVNAAGASAWTAWVLRSSGDVPVAVIAPTGTGTATLPMTFDGSGSTFIRPAVSWEWSFGDGRTGSGATVSHTYAAAGTYQVMLTVTDAVGSTNFARTTVTVNPAPAVPVAPGNLKATSTVRKRVDLTWTNTGAEGATSFLVYRCTGSTCTKFTRMTTLFNTATAWSDATVRSGTTYRYYVASLYSTVTLPSSIVTVKAR